MSGQKKPTIVVTNGTAGEGYWSVYYLLRTGRFDVRATVRRPTSEHADRLRRLDVDGDRCEIVQASNEDEQALRVAFAGAHGIYGTTIYNIHAKKYRADNPEEMAQGIAVINAAKTCETLQHFVWQTMTKFERTPEEEGLESPIHFRTKWKLERIVQDQGLPWTLLRQPAYIRQIKFGLMRKNKLVYPYPPDTRLSYVAEEDIGKCVAQLFLDRDRFLHTTVKAVSEVTTPVELAQRIHAVNPQFSPRYRQASFLYNAFFDYVVCGFNPAFRYVSQINGNLMAGNPFAMNESEKAFCSELISPLRLNTIEDWLAEEDRGAETP